MEKIVNGYRIIADNDSKEIMVKLYGIWQNARYALTSQAFWGLYKATFKENQ